MEYRLKIKIFNPGFVPVRKSPLMKWPLGRRNERNYD